MELFCHSLRGNKSTERRFFASAKSGRYSLFRPGNQHFRDLPAAAAYAAPAPSREKGEERKEAKPVVARHQDEGAEESPECHTLWSRRWKHARLACSNRADGVFQAPSPSTMRDSRPLEGELTCASSYIHGTGKVLGRSATPRSRWRKARSLPGENLRSRQVRAASHTSRRVACHCPQHPWLDEPDPASRPSSLHSSSSSAR